MNSFRNELNENEIKVLKSLIEEMHDCTGGSFGNIDGVNHCGFTKHEFAGYVGSLVKKGAFEYLDSDGANFGYKGNFCIKPELMNIRGDNDLVGELEHEEASTGDE